MTKTLFRAVFAAMTIVGLLSVAAPAKAQTDYFWNAPNGGTGTWDTTTQNWATLLAGQLDYTWLNNGTERANFGDTAGTVTLGTGITAFGVNFSTSGYIITGNTLTLAGAGGVVDTSTFDATIGSILAGTVGLTKTGTGTLTLAGANTFTGVMNINAGVIRANNTTTFGALAAGNETVVAAGAAIHINNTINISNELLTLNGTGISNTGALRKLGTGNASWAGGITLASSSRIESDGGLFTISGGITGGANNLTIGGAGNISIGSVASTLTGTLEKVGTGTLTMTINNAGLTGPITVREGVLSISLSTILGTTGDLTIDGGTVRETNPGNAGSFVSATRKIVVGPSGGTVDYTPSGPDYSFTTIYGPTQANGGTITGGTLTKTGPGEFRFQNFGTSIATFQKLVVNQGLFRLGSVTGQNYETGFGAVPASFMADNITLNGGSIGTSFTLTLNANRGITLGTRGGAINANGAPLTVPGAITGTGPLYTWSGGQSITLQSTASDYTGRTVLATGILSVASVANGGAASSIGSSSNSADNLVFSGGRLQYSGAGASTDRLFTITAAGGQIESSGTGALVFTNTGANPSTDPANTSFTLNSTSTFALLTSTATPFDLTGLAAGMTVSGTGVAPGTTVSAISPTLAQFTLSAAATGTGTNTLTFGSINRTLTLSGTNTGTNTIAGTLADSPTTLLGVTKAGTGTWVLSGNNTYSGITAVQTGRLLINGNHTGTGAVSVSANGTLGGSGSLAGAVAVTGGLAPGNIIGTLTVNNSVTFNAGSTFTIELDAGSGQSDRLVSTSLVLGAGNATLNLSGVGTPTLTQEFLIAQNVTPGSTAVSGTFNSLANGAQAGTISGVPVYIFYDSRFNGTSITTEAGSVIITAFNPVPEPTTILAVGALAFGLIRRFRRK